MGVPAFAGTHVPRTMPMPEPVLPSDERPEAVIAGTLCLMSCYVQHPVPVYAERVAANLDRMTRLPDLSPELRSICLRLSVRWQALRCAADARVVAREEVADARRLH